MHARIFNKIIIILCSFIFLLPGASVAVEISTEKDRLLQMEQENWELKNEINLLKEELNQKKENELILETEKKASERSRDAGAEKAEVGEKKVKLEREQRILLEKKTKRIQMSFYFPGAARYQNGEWGKGILWSATFFGMIAADAAAWSDLQKKKAASHSLAANFTGSNNQAYEGSFRRTNLLLLLTGLAYVFNIADAAYFAEPKMPESGSVQFNTNLGKSYAEISWKLFF